MSRLPSLVYLEVIKYQMVTKINFKRGFNNMSGKKEYIRKYIAFSLDEWADVEAYANSHFFSSESEAVRLLISRGVVSTEKVIPRKYGPLAMQKHLHFSFAQWDTIERFRFENRIDSSAQAIRILVARGLEVEKRIESFIKESC